MSWAVFLLGFLVGGTIFWVGGIAYGVAREQSRHMRAEWLHANAMRRKQERHA